MNKEEWKEYLYRVRDAIDFQLRFSLIAGASNIVIDREYGYLLLRLIESQIEKMDGERKDEE